MVCRTILDSSDFLSAVAPLVMFGTVAFAYLENVADR